MTPEIKFLHTAFAVDGFKLYVVGGAVRDFVMGVEPHDYDLCTDATPNQMVKLAEKHNFHTIPTGLQHGTLTFVVHGKAFEVTTFRIDVVTDGRHAEVAFTSDILQDSFRRDFTINAMYWDIEQDSLVDFHKGKDDADKKVVKFVGEPADRIKEDYLRVWRFIRFTTRFTTPAKRTNAIRSVAMNEVISKIDPDEYSNGIGSLSGERIWVEMKKSVAHDAFATCVGIAEFNLFNSFVPEGTVTPNRFVKRCANFASFFKKIDKAVGDNLIDEEFATLAKISVIVGPRHLEKFMATMKVSRQEKVVLEVLSKQLFDSMTRTKNKVYLMALNNKPYARNVLVATLIKAKRGDTKQEVDKSDIALWGEFPFTGRYFMNLGFPSGKKLGAKIAMMQSLFINAFVKGEQYDVAIARLHKAASNLT